MLDLGGVRDRDEFIRRLAITAALLVAYRLGTFIPLPGIEPQALARLGGVAERISIFALGVTPFITILVLAELLKVVAPSVRRWEQASERNRHTLNRIVVGLSLLAAAAQASGLALALEDVKGLVSEPGTPFRLTSILILVAATATIIWLAYQITRQGIGSGVWLLLVAPWIADMLPRLATLALWQHDGSLLAFELLIGFALTALVIAATVAVIRVCGDTLQANSTSLWSVLLADAAWPWLMLALAVLLGGGALGAQAWLKPAHPISLLLLVVLVAVFVQLYVRSQRLAGAAVLATPALLAVGLALAKLLEILLATQIGWLVPLAGHQLLITIVALSLLARWWQPPFAEHAEHPELDELLSSLSPPARTDTWRAP
jgi:SecY